MVRFLISMTEELRNTLKSVADRRGQTLCGLIRQILWEWVENRKQEERRGENGDRKEII